MDLYWTLVFLHVIAFAYWLGGDFGVYVTGGYVARADLPLAERLRFLDALLKIDILPRTGIVLLPVLGLQIAALLAIGLYLRSVIKAWRVGFVELQRGPSESAERLIALGIQRGRRGAWLFWAIIALTAYLGVGKPF